MRENQRVLPRERLEPIGRAGEGPTGLLRQFIRYHPPEFRRRVETGAHRSAALRESEKAG